MLSEINVEELGQLASYNVPFGDYVFSPAITKDEKGFIIRILTGFRNTPRGKSGEWNYFYADLNGVIIESPRGYAKQFNKKRILDIEQKFKEYENKRINHY